MKNNVRLIVILQEQNIAPDLHFFSLFNIPFLWEGGKKKDSNIWEFSHNEFHILIN